MNLDPTITEDLTKYLEQKLRDRKNEVVVVSAYKLDQDEIALIHEKIPQLKEAHIQNEVDPSVIAGIVINFGSKTIDLSLRRELHQLHKYFL